METDFRPIRRDRAWPGLALVLLGGLYLWSNGAGLHLSGAWAILLVVPAVAAFVRAWPGLTESGGPDAGAVRAVLGGLVLLVIAATSATAFPWRLAWPLMVMLVGGMMIARPSRSMR